LARVPFPAATNMSAVRIIFGPDIGELLCVGS